MKPKKSETKTDQLSFPSKFTGYEQATDPDEKDGDYEEAMDSMAPDGYDQGMGTDSCS